MCPNLVRLFARCYFAWPRSLKVHESAQQQLKGCNFIHDGTRPLAAAVAVAAASTNQDDNNNNSSKVDNKRAAAKRIGGGVGGESGPFIIENASKTNSSDQSETDRSHRANQPASQHHQWQLLVGAQTGGRVGVGSTKDDGLPNRRSLSRERHTHTHKWPPNKQTKRINLRRPNPPSLTQSICSILLFFSLRFSLFLSPYRSAIILPHSASSWFVHFLLQRSLVLTFPSTTLSLAR